jgi:hypothetical protein
LRKENENLRKENLSLQQKNEIFYQNNQSLKKMIEDKKEKFDSVNKSSIPKVPHEKGFSVVEPLVSELNCSSCQNLLDNPHSCTECLKNFCLKCCKEEKFCPSGICENEEVDKNPILSKKISKLNVKCSYCEKMMSKLEVEKHLEEHVEKCQWGCEFVGQKKLLYLHENDCTHFFQFQKEQKEKYVETLPLFFYDILQIVKEEK